MREETIYAKISMGLSSRPENEPMMREPNSQDRHSRPPHGTPSLHSAAELCSYSVQWKLTVWIFVLVTSSTKVTFMQIVILRSNLTV